MHFLYVGRMHDTKGVRFLLEIFDALPLGSDFKVTLVGGGNELEDLQKGFGSRNWIHFVGTVHSSQVRSYMLDADILCVPSLWFENSPLVIYEALHCGFPCLQAALAGSRNLCGTTPTAFWPGPETTTNGNLFCPTLLINLTS